MTFSLIIFMCLLGLSSQRSTPEDNSYVAAVVEYEVQSNADVNLANYINLIKDAADQNADIVVFPELTLSSRVSVSVPINGLLIEHPVPALEPELFDEILVSISSAARDNGIYVVINVQEIVNCAADPVGENCPEKTTYYFNTNVVFDREGAVIDRYRKINLFGEFSRTPALTPDLGVFTTDFGVTFGHYICFDLMFQVPAVQVVEKNNITDVIFTTMWFSEMPYLTAVQIQEAYAQSMDVNFLAAGANNVRVGSAGSGIYSGKAGALVSIMPGVPTTRLLVARVPKIPGQVEGRYPGPIYDNPTDQDNLVLISDPSLPSHVTRLLTPGSQEFTLMERDTVCHFRINLVERNSETAPHYRAFAMDGVNVYAKRSVGTAGCAIVACKTEETKSCAYKFTNENKREIKELDIQMTSYRKQYNDTLKCENVEYFPLSLRNNKFPLSPKNFSYTDDSPKNAYDNEILRRNDREYIGLSIKMPQSELISFGIWARIYTRDGKNNFAPTQDDKQKYLDVEEVIFGRDVNRKMPRAFPQYIPDATARFEELTITAAVPTPRLNSNLSAPNAAYFPVSLDTFIMPLKPEYFEFTHVSPLNIINVYNLRLVRPTNDLYSFGVWGREFTTDGREASPPVEHDDGTTDSNDEVTASPDIDNDGGAPDASVMHKLSIILLLLTFLLFIIHL